MSRIGKLPVVLNGVKAKIENNFLIISSAKGELKQALHPLVNINISETEIVVSINDLEDKKQCALWGLYRQLINNMVEGLATGFTKELEIIGVGYKAAVAGQKLTLNLGFSHPIEFLLPDKIKGEVKANIISLTSIDKQLVGEMAAQIRKLRKPEPYKGKGIRYVGEVVRKKAGKAAAANK
jgi:large subunit ribosomal protein L6